MAVVFGLCLLITPVMAEEMTDEVIEPSMELLEFLADWSDEEEWLDLEELEKMNLPQQERNRDEG